MRSARIILAVFSTLLVGLAVTAALGLMMVGALNLISVAFAVLFVGLGVDFGIQFASATGPSASRIATCKRALVHAAEDRRAADAGRGGGAAGFLSFLPTDYRGVSELGLIAGVGMLIAFVTSITLLPALLTVLNPPGEPRAGRLSRRWRRSTAFSSGTASRDRRHAAVVALGGMPLLFYLHLRLQPDEPAQPAVESVATYPRPAQDPNTGANASTCWRRRGRGGSSRAAREAAGGRCAP